MPIILREMVKIKWVGILQEKTASHQSCIPGLTGLQERLFIKCVNDFYLVKSSTILKRLKRSRHLTLTH